MPYRNELTRANFEARDIEKYKSNAHMVDKYDWFKTREKEQSQVSYIGEANLYHYTSFEAFSSIIKSSSMWATDARYLNDIEEMHYGIKLIKERLYFAREREIDEHARHPLNMMIAGAPIIETMPQVFCISFSKYSDELGQWRGYGARATGIALKMDVRPQASNNCGTNLMQVIYDAREQEAIVDGDIARVLEIRQIAYGSDESDTIAALCSMMFRHLAFARILSFKSPHWSREGEWRLMSGQELFSAELHHRVSDAGIVPYVNLPLRTKKLRKPLLPLENVVIGPRHNAEQVKSSIADFLNVYGYQFMEEISVSKIPLR